MVLILIICNCTFTFVCRKFKSLSYFSLEQLPSVVHIASLRGAGAFSRDFTTDLNSQCMAFSRALKTEKLNAPLFPGPVGPWIQLTGARVRVRVELSSVTLTSAAAPSDP